MYSANQSLKLIDYMNTNHVNDEDDRKSFLSYYFFLDDKSVAISYSFKKQSLIVQSTMKAKIIALSHATKETL